MSFYIDHHYMWRPVFKQKRINNKRKYNKEITELGNISMQAQAHIYIVDQCSILY